MKGLAMSIQPPWTCRLPISSSGQRSAWMTRVQYTATARSHSRGHSPGDIFQELRVHDQDLIPREAEGGNNQRTAVRLLAGQAG
jgi:hypothetical protein